MKTCTKALLIALTLVVSTCFSRAASIVWTNTAGGNWSATNNWSPNQSPGPADVAVITNDGNYTVTQDVNASVGGLILGAPGDVNTQTFLLNGQTLTLSGNAVVSANGQLNLNGGTVIGANAVLSGALNCSGVTFSGTLTVASNGVLNLGGLPVTFDGYYAGVAALTNYGTVNWLGATVNGNNRPRIENYGLWNATADGVFQGGQPTGTTTFDNFGTFRKSGGSGTNTLDNSTTFHTTGTVDVESGTVAVQAGSGSGVWNVNTAVSLGSDFVFAGGVLFSGTGIVNGFIIGNGAVLSGALNCSGVTFSGTLTVASNGVLNLGGLPVTFDGYYAGVAALTNYGTVNWLGATVNGNNRPRIENYGLWNATADGVFQGGQPTGTTTFDNFGTFRKSGGSGTNTLDNSTTFHTTGTVDVESGAVAVQAGSGSGVWNVNTAVSLGSGFVFAGGVLFSGTGIVNGFIIGNGAVLSGALNCSGVTFSGTLTVSNAAVLNLGGLPVTFDGNYAGVAALTNYGTVNWLGATVNGNNSPRIENYGLWNATADGVFQGSQPHGASTFDNFGTFRKSGGNGTNTLDNSTTFHTTGTVDVESGTVAVQAGSGSGVWNVNTAVSLGSGFVFAGGVLFSGTGIVNGFIIGNNAVFSGALNCSGATFSGTLTVSNNGVLNLGGLPVTFDSFYAGIAVLTNYGTVNWLGATVNGNNSPRIENYGLWNATTDGVFQGSQPHGTTTFDNFGTFRKSGGTGTNALDNLTTFNTTGTVDVESGTVAVQAGSGSGVWNVNTAVSLGSGFVFAGGVLFSGTGIVNGFIIGNNAVFSGALNCSGATFSGTLTVSNNGVLNLGGLPVTFDSFYAGIAVLTNYGTVNWLGATVNGNNRPRIENYGLWNATADGVFQGSQPHGTTTFDNFGTFRKSGGTGTNALDNLTTFNTTGTVDVESGTVAVQAGSGSGVWNVNTAVSLGSGFVFAGGVLFSGTGIVNGFIIGNNAVFSGALNCSGATFSGTLTVSNNGVLNLGGLPVTFDSFYAGIAVLTNYGTVNWLGATVNGNNRPRIENYGLWNATADGVFQGGQPTGTTTFDNFGTFRKSGGTGTNALDNLTTFNTTGTVDVESGTVNLSGDRTLSGGILNFGINSSNNFGRISISGNAVLGGVVSANLNNLFAPRASNSFAVVLYGSRTGTFTNFNLPAGLNWTNNYGSSAFSLQVASVAPANLSGTVATQGGTNFTFSFGAVPGQIYQIQYTTNLAPANWINLGGPIQATNPTVTVTDLINQNPQLFYRAVLQ